VGLFRTKAPPAFGASTVNAAAGAAGRPGSLQSYVVGAKTQRALSIPTISRARDLIVSLIGALDFRTYRLEWSEDEERYLKRYIQGESWMTRPDPNCTRSFIMGMTVQDMILSGRAFWYVTSRYRTGFPASFTWLPHDNINTPNQAGPEWYGPADVIEFNGVEVDPNNVVQFLSPNNALLWQGARAIDIAYRLDEAAKRFASNEIAAGYLQQTDGEPMSGDELSELSAAWAEARQSKAVGALNQHVEWKEFTSTPDKLQLVEGRQHAAMELARVANIPPYLVGVEVGGMTYQNALQARQDLYLFGARPLVDAIEQTLSGDNVVAKGKHIELDVEAYLRETEQSREDNRTLSAAEVAQKVYLAVANNVMTRDEARDMIRDAGANLPEGSQPE
jgi:hypothetical protein